ncbi:MAG: hypothetical protein U0L18_07475, partial [Acutalibacteraceae bacterium]|nr:hypothetical protein [Acutalibacteraceae bacterium]
MSDKKDYKDLSIDEKMLLLDGKLAYLDKLVDYYEGKISKLEQLEKTLQASDTQKDEPVVSTDVESTAINTVEEAVKEEPTVEATEEPVAEADTNADSEPVAMGGSFGFGGNEALDEEYAPVEKEPIVLENVPLGGSFGFEAEDTKVATISNIEEETTENIEETTVEATEEPVAEADTNADSEPVAMGGSFGFGGNEALDEEYAPVEKEPIVLENV